MTEGGPIGSLDPLLPALHDTFLRCGVALAYLYGSQARGDIGPLSDVDIAVLFQPDIASSDRSDRLLDLIGELMTVFKRSDVFVADLVNASPLLRHRVYRDGRLLYCADDRLRVKFLTEALRDYEDTRPLRIIQHYYLMQSIADGTFGRARSVVAEDKEKYG
jgi:predicted nucleotidyltransferase